MKQTYDYDLEAARKWLTESCHHAGVRQLLERGLDYVDALDRAGIPPRITPGDELYDFLCDPGSTASRFKAFMPPTM